MSELIIPPSPNWFLSDCLSVGADGYLVYGTLSSNLAIVVPNESSPLYFSDVKIIKHAHKERITCVSLCPNWLNTRLFISGADDGFVKLWNAQTCSVNIAHNTHFLKKENVVSALFLDSNRVLSVGTQSLCAIWNIKSNCVESDSKVIKFFKPLCLALCPHRPNTVALGTKQGVVVILSVSNKISILYKAPGHNAEITSLSWCPTVNCKYLDNIKETAKTPSNRKNKPKKTTSIQDRLKRPQNDDENQSFDDQCVENQTLHNVDEFVNGKATQENLLNKKQLENDEKIIEEIQSCDDFLKECQETLKLIENIEEISFQQDSTPVKSEKKKKFSSFDEYGRSKYIPKLIDDEINNTIDDSILETTIDTECSFNVADESDIFDIYADPDIEEFGHKKNIPDPSTFLMDTPVKNHNFIKNCNMSVENGMSSLVDEMNRIHLQKSEDNDLKSETFYLASCCKKGLLCIWKWGGSLVFSKPLNSISKNKITRKVTHPFGAIHWLSSSELIVASKESQLLRLTFSIDEAKVILKNLHNEHKRGLFRVTSNISSDLDSKKNVVWTASMDRLLVGHSIVNNRTNVYSTFGGFVYDIQVSPIDPTMFAVGAGDGTIRTWRFIDAKSEDIIKIQFLKQYWNGISGKVLSMAWHPTREKCLAFTTYEGRIGLLDVSTENSAKILPLSLSLGAFHVCWDLSNNLYACGGNMLVVYDTSKPDKDPTKLLFNICNEKWDISTMSWCEKFLSIGSSQGGFALLTPSYPHELVVAAYPHKKRIQQIAFHPKAVTSDDEISPFSDLIAVSANAKNLVVLKFVEFEGSVKLETYADFAIHLDNITSISWNPHYNGQILSTSKDCTVQIWDVVNKTLLHTFASHQDPALTAIWCSLSPNVVFSSGGDHTLRIWDINKYPPQEELCIKEKQRKKMTLAKLSEFDNNLATLQLESEEQINAKEFAEINSEILNTKLHGSEDNINLAAISKPSDKKYNKKHYPLASFWKEYKRSSSEGCRQLFNKLKIKPEENNECPLSDSNELNYMKIFGTHCDIEDILNAEQNTHKETFNWNSVVIVGVLSGKLKETLEYISEKGKLTPSFLSLAPSVSHRFWKEMLSAYCTQLEGDNKKCVDPPIENLGKIWQGVLFLSAGQIEDGCMSLSSAGLEAEAICAARVRRADHIANKHLKLWCQAHITSANFCKAAECHLALGQIMEAATILGKSCEETELALAAEIAKFGGNTVLAESLTNAVQ